MRGSLELLGTETPFVMFTFVRESVKQQVTKMERLGLLTYSLQRSSRNSLAARLLVAVASRLRTHSRLYFVQMEEVYDPYDDPWIADQYIVTRVGGDTDSSTVASDEGPEDDGPSPVSFTTTPSIVSVSVPPGGARHHGGTDEHAKGGSAAAEGVQPHAHPLPDSAHHEAHHNAPVEVRRGRLWLRPILAHDWGRPDKHRKVDWSELFSDLVVVAGQAELIADALKSCVEEAACTLFGFCIVCSRPPNQRCDQARAVLGDHWHNDRRVLGVRERVERPCSLCVPVSHQRHDVQDL